MNNDDIHENSIIVKHIPKEFTHADCEEFFSFFNSKSVTYFANKGPMQHIAIVTFVSYDAAHAAIFKLHERKVLNSRLSAQFLKVKSNINPNISDRNDENSKCKESDSQIGNIIPDWITKLLSIAPKWGLDGPIQPKLKYNYPKPNNIVLTNIVRSLIANEYFYTQTLHLMNKFHFPAPFTPDVTFPGNVTVVNNDDIENNHNLKRRKQTIVESTEMEVSSGNESEISDEENHPKVKRQKRSFPKIPTNRLSNNNYEYNFKSVKNVGLDEMFENKEPKSDSHIEIRPISSIEEISDIGNHGDSSLSFVEEGFGKMDQVIISANSANGKESKRSQEIIPVIDGMSENLIVEDFKLRKDKIIKEKPNSTIIGRPSKVYSLDEIKEKILAKSEWKSVNALKNYNPGIPSSQLYVKNISKKVSKEDLISLYAAFIDWSNESEVSSFSVTYFMEGRLKGQAFVSFSSQSIAEKALESTNAFHLFEKPISVQFSKCANT